VAKLLSRLGALDRSILELRYVDGRTSMDIGHELDMAPSSVRSRMTRVRGDFAALEA
jgi:DNA-directed RNA polymerase specialized sigma24 family protein